MYIHVVELKDGNKIAQSVFKQSEELVRFTNRIK